MNELPPSIRDPRKTDADHLKLLAVFHYVVAGFAVLGIGFLILHYTMMSHFMLNHRSDASGSSRPCRRGAARHCGGGFRSEEIRASTDTGLEKPDAGPDCQRTES